MTVYLLLHCDCEDGISIRGFESHEARHLAWAEYGRYADLEGYSMADMNLDGSKIETFWPPRPGDAA
jgi:hypothetical protein